MTLCAVTVHIKNKLITPLVSIRENFTHSWGKATVYTFPKVFFIHNKETFFYHKGLFEQFCFILFQPWVCNFGLWWCMTLTICVMRVRFAPCDAISITVKIFSHVLSYACSEMCLNNHTQVCNSMSQYLYIHFHS